MLGKQIAEDMQKLNLEDTAIIALNEGGAVIAIEIAKKLHSSTSLLLLKHVHLPGNLTLGIINDQGHFTYDQSMQQADIDEFTVEFRGSIEMNKSEALKHLHSMGSGSLDPHYFTEKNIIIVSDTANTGTAFRAAADFLKPIRTGKIVLVAAIALLPAIDVMHRIGDVLHIVHATDKQFPTDHYFEDDSIPESKALDFMRQQHTLRW